MKSEDDYGVELDRVGTRSAEALTAAQRRRFQTLLQDLWRDQVDRLTALSVRVHGDDLTNDERTDVERQLEEVRSSLGEIEDALQRLGTPTLASYA